MNWYPLRFAPIYRQYMWGGQRFRTSLGRKDLDSNAIYAESWEICDHRGDRSRVLAGDLAGKTLHDLVASFGSEILGVQGVCAQRALARQSFPLILKYLDGQRNLSLQVHPDNAMGATLDPPDLGKTEAWVVLEAEPGSLIYAGLKPGVDRQEFEKSLRSGEGDRCVHRFEAQPGDCVLLPAGMVHA
ncbi:MAG: class I mannose-6-phosphate isomerase, partial [Pirellulales bacterium]|nr:class I mannose-6-phosphate isomerase [Pirellulales bacterium]